MCVVSFVVCRLIDSKIKEIDVDVLKTWTASAEDEILAQGLARGPSGSRAGFQVNEDCELPKTLRQVLLNVVHHLT